MRIVFFGSPDFARIILEKLLLWDGGEVTLVVTQPDKKAGRGQKVTSTPVKRLALEHKIEVIEPKNLKNDGIKARLRDAKADLFIVVAYGLILPGDVISIPTFGTVNVHASLLPKYRGAAPIQWAILNGEKVTGVTIMQMDEGLDTGPILSQKALAIGINDTAKDLHDELAKLGGELLINTLEKIKKGKIIPIKQDDSCASYAPKLSKDMGLINWKDSAINIHNKIRALYPWPMAYFNFQAKKRWVKVQVYPGKIGNELSRGVSPGEILGIRDGFLEIACMDRSYLVPKLKPESSKILTAEQFACGYLANKS